MPLKVLLAAAAEAERLIRLLVFVPVDTVPVAEMLRPVVVTDPELAALVNDSLAKLAPVVLRLVLVSVKVSPLVAVGSIVKLALELMVLAPVQ